MTSVTIKDMLDAHAAATEKVWAHDRTSTLGASAAFQCARKTWFALNAVPHDEGYADRYGARKRGDLVEAHWVVPALRAGLPPGCDLLWAGEEQRTLVDGYNSATPDGLAVNRSDRDMTIEGIILPPGGCVCIEIKSIDPRVDLREAKAEHTGQVHVQMGLVRDCTEFRPEVALIVYIDASFFDGVTVFPVRFDPAIYAAARQRAMTAMTANDAAALPPEGRIAGGGECQYCPYRHRCAGETARAIPDEDATLSDVEIAEAAELVMRERLAEEEKKAAAAAHAAAQEKLKDFLRGHGTRRAQGQGWSVSYFAVKGRKTLDQDAATAAGIDLTRFMREGDPSERLTVKMSN